MKIYMKEFILSGEGLLQKEKFILSLKKYINIQIQKEV